MKAKYLIIIVAVVLVLLFYNLFCYSLINKTIYKGTENIITNYFKEISNDTIDDYEFIRATNDIDNKINIYVKTNHLKRKEYYHFIFLKSGNVYQLLKVDKEIPAYIK